MKKKILCITAMYPLDQNDNLSGIFVKEQLDAIEDNSDYFFEVFNLRQYSTFYRYTVAQLKIILKIIRFKYSIIHIHYSISGLFLLLFKPKNLKVIITFHGSDILEGDNSLKKNIQTYLSKILARKADNLIVVNSKMKDILLKYNTNISIIPCGVNVNYFKRTKNETFKQKHGSNLIKIIFPSDPLRKEKNYKLFSEIIERLRKRNKDDIEVIAFRGLSRSEIRRELIEANCLLLTSISEGSPQVVKEALACNTPVVSRKVGDVDVVLDKVDDCYVISGDNVDTYVKAIEKILEKKTNLAENSINKLKELELDNETIARKIVKLYD
ncbi:glycosyltransferase family 4 protein [Flammeovirga aprica]|uniref:Glycosyltransferase family 4 protein n=1 Tax=Flammeovirga aprica JL-4 TaxID=694437 RepID=A0A7X9P1P3_9BACT|nr:glycosyltransferase family 4 protein [Flammeovirga aprica]NME67670.1 glycosyltransferase family 4 protein [Flammeovirga aprica JL-4]